MPNGYDRYNPPPADYPYGAYYYQSRAQRAGLSGAAYQYGWQLIVGARRGGIGQGKSWEQLTPTERYLYGYTNLYGEQFSPAHEARYAAAGWTGREYWTPEQWAMQAEREAADVGGIIPREYVAKKAAGELAYQPRFEPAFYDIYGGLGGSRPWKEWFESRYSDLLRRFQATSPAYEKYLGREREAEAFLYGRGGRYAPKELMRPGAKPMTGERIEKSWAQWLKGQVPELREEWYSYAPYRRGERPQTFAPRIQTVQF